MVFNFLLFIVKIERNVPSKERLLAEYERSQYLKKREESYFMEAANYPDYVSRV